MVDKSLEQLLKGVKIQFKNDNVSKYLQTQTIKAYVDGICLETTADVIQNTIAGRIEFYCPVYDANKTPTTLIQNSLDQINDIWHSIANTGKAVFKYSHKGDVKHPINLELNAFKNHLKLATFAKLDFKFMGRYFTAVFVKDINAYMGMRIRDVHVINALSVYFDELKQAESHCSDTIIDKHYNCFAGTKEHDFTCLDKHTDLMALRMASHPLIKPGRKTPPNTFVDPVDTEGDFLSRADNMSKLTLYEQNVQLFYLSKVWALYDTVDRLIEEGLGSSPGLQRVKTKLDNVMAEAQTLHASNQRKNFRKRRRRR